MDTPNSTPPSQPPAQETLIERLIAVSARSAFLVIMLALIFLPTGLLGARGLRKV